MTTSVEFVNKEILPDLAKLCNNLESIKFLEIEISDLLIKLNEKSKTSVPVSLALHDIAVPQYHLCAALKKQLESSYAIFKLLDEDPNNFNLDSIDFLKKATEHLPKQTTSGAAATTNINKGSDVLKKEGEAKNKT